MLLPQPSWVSRFRQAHHCGRHLLLYDNIHDMVPCRDRYEPLTGFLRDYFSIQEKYALVVRYDLMDQFRFADEKDQQRFARLVAPAATGGSSTFGEIAERHTTPPGLQIRSALRQTSTRIAIVVDLSEMLTDGSGIRETDVAFLRAIVRGIRETALEKDCRSTVVLLAGRLEAVPPWVYRDNPHIAPIRVEPPGSEERAAFVRQFSANFYGSTEATPTAADVEAFADLTAGLTTWQLDMVRRTSRTQEIPLSRTRDLVQFFRHGRTDDPWANLSDEKLRTAAESLERRVVGQTLAVQRMVDLLARSRVGVRAEPPGRAQQPKGVFFFVGPTGVGKTELAKALAELVFGDESALMRFDMSEYAAPHAAERLTGSPPGYVGHGEGGQLTNRVIQQPFSVLLFDEIEKANSAAFDRFLQVLEDGRLTDGRGETAYFSDCALIFTSNIGAAELASRRELPVTQEVERLLGQAVKDFFVKELRRPELLNRLGENIIVFDILRPEFYPQVCEKFFRWLKEQARVRCELHLQFPDNSVAELVRKVVEDTDRVRDGGRAIRSIIQSRIEYPLNRWILRNKPAPGSVLSLRANHGGDGLIITGTG